VEAPSVGGNQPWATTQTVFKCLFQMSHLARERGTTEIASDACARVVGQGADGEPTTYLDRELETVIVSAVLDSKLPVDWLCPRKSEYLIGVQYPVD
jgi:hypothetical protein